MLNRMDDTDNYKLNQIDRINSMIAKARQILGTLNNFLINVKESSENVKNNVVERIKKINFSDNDTQNLLKETWADRDNMLRECKRVINSTIHIIEIFIKFYGDLQKENKDVLGKIRQDFVLTKKPPPHDAIPIWPLAVSHDNKRIYEDRDENLYEEFKNEFDMKENRDKAEREYHEINKILVKTFDNFKNVRGSFERDGYISTNKQYIFKVPLNRKWTNPEFDKIIYTLEAINKKNYGQSLSIIVYFKTPQGNYTVIDTIEPKNNLYYVYDSILEPIFERGILTKFRVKLIDSYL